MTLPTITNGVTTLPYSITTAYWDLLCSAYDSFLLHQVFINWTYLSCPVILIFTLFYSVNFLFASLEAGTFFLLLSPRIPCIVEVKFLNNWKGNISIQLFTNFLIIAIRLYTRIHFNCPWIIKCLHSYDISPPWFWFSFVL